MDKNWLLRTKSNHILGPISKEKVLELYNNGSIKPDDEVCSGNGFWFFIRENDMVERYILGQEVQGFNPISEAKDILTQSHPPGHIPEASQADITLVGGVDLAQLRAKKAPVAEPIAPIEIPATPKAESVPTPRHLEIMPQDQKKKINSEFKVKISSNGGQANTLKKQSYLKYVGILGFLLLFLLIYMRKTIIRTLFQGEMTFSPTSFIIDSVHAQDTDTPKKKSF